MSIDIKNITVVKNSYLILEKINISFPSRGISFVIGKNGVGKSTLLRSLALLEKSTGDVYFNRQNIKDISYKDRCKTIAWLDSSFVMEWNHAVIDVVLMGRFPWHRGYVSKKDHQRAFLALQDLEIENLSDRKIHSLSSGQKQSVMIARAIAGDHEVLILDEPASNLDFSKSITLFKKLKVIAQKKTIIVSNHDHLLTLKFADYIALIQDRKTIKTYKFPSSGDFSEIFSNLNIPIQVSIKKVFDREFSSCEILF